MLASLLHGLGISHITVTFGGKPTAS